MNNQTIYFKDPAARSETPPDVYTGEEPEDVEAAGKRYVLCRQCRHMVTAPDEGTWVDGSHRHTFANPVGVVYEIGCFNSAPGCRSVGPATDEFTWFSGYLWRVAICGKCLTHLGWQFISTAGHGFYGLITDRLIEPEQSA